MERYYSEHTNLLRHTYRHTQRKRETHTQVGGVELPYSRSRMSLQFKNIKTVEVHTSVSQRASDTSCRPKEIYILLILTVSI